MQENEIFSRFWGIVKDLCKNQARSQHFTSAHSVGTNPHAARACSILCGELSGYPKQLNGYHHTLTQHTVLDASVVGVVQIEFWQKKNPKIGHSQV